MNTKMMKTKKLLFLQTLFIFSIVLLFAGLFHTDNNLQDDLDRCIICNWQRTSLAIQQIYILLVSVSFVVFFTFEAENWFTGNTEYLSIFNSRAPPIQ